VEEQRHERPVHGEINTISRGFSGGGCTASQHKKYTREVMMVEARELDQADKPDLCLTKADLRDLVSHKDDPVVISVVTADKPDLSSLPQGPS